MAAEAFTADSHPSRREVDRMSPVQKTMHAVGKPVRRLEALAVTIAFLGFGYNTGRSILADHDKNKDDVAELRTQIQLTNAKLNDTTARVGSLDVLFREGTMHLNNEVTDIRRIVLDVRDEQRRHYGR